MTSFENLSNFEKYFDSNLFYSTPKMKNSSWSRVPSCLLLTTTASVKPKSLDVKQQPREIRKLCINNATQYSPPTVEYQTHADDANSTVRSSLSPRTNGITQWRLRRRQHTYKFILECLMRAPEASNTHRSNFSLFLESTTQSVTPHRFSSWT